MCLYVDILPAFLLVVIPYDYVTLEGENYYTASLLKCQLICTLAC